MELKKGETIMIDAALHLPAACLHEAFSDRCGFPPDHFELYYRGKRLEGEAALSSWGVGKDSTIEVKMRGRGGMQGGGGGGGVKARETEASAAKASDLAAEAEAEEGVCVRATSSNIEQSFQDIEQAEASEQLARGEAVDTLVNTLGQTSRETVPPAPCMAPTVPLLAPIT